MEATRINNDINGNPRYVFHFLDLLTEIEKDSNMGIESKYKLALLRAKQLGGKKYNTKSFGGGIVFQSYNIENLKTQIKNLWT